MATVTQVRYNSVVLMYMYIVFVLLQILDMKENELDMVAKHLGHDPKTHKDFYRLSHSTLELSKVFHAESRMLDMHAQLHTDLGFVDMVVIE